MSDSPTLPPPLTDIREETQSGSVSRSTSQPTLYGLDSVSAPTTTAFPAADAAHTHHHDHQAHPPVTGKPKTRPRGNSSVSHVDLEFFDPSGVQALRRTMTQENVDHSRSSSDSSEATLNIKDDQPFDFEKTLRHVIRKCAFCYRLFRTFSLINSMAGAEKLISNHVLSELCFEISKSLDRQLRIHSSQH